MIDFIVKYWLEFALGILGTGMLGWIKSLQDKLKQKEVEYAALREGMKAILHDRLFDICNHYLALGYIPVEKSEEILDNAKMIYDAYHAIGGNGTGTTIYEKFTSLKVKKSPEGEG